MLSCKYNLTMCAARGTRGLHALSLNARFDLYLIVFACLLYMMCIYSYVCERARFNRCAKGLRRGVVECGQIWLYIACVLSRPNNNVCIWRCTHTRFDRGWSLIRAVARETKRLDITRIFVYLATAELIATYKQAEN